MMSLTTPLILINKFYTAPSVFVPENLLRQARRQKSIPEGDVPAICVLDPDGDIVQHLRDREQAHRNPHWACYHTDPKIVRACELIREVLVEQAVEHAELVGAHMAPRNRR